MLNRKYYYTFANTWNNITRFLLNTRFQKPRKVTIIEQLLSQFIIGTRNLHFYLITALHTFFRPLIQEGGSSDQGQLYQSVVFAPCRIRAAFTHVILMLQSFSFLPSRWTNITSISDYPSRPPVFLVPHVPLFLNQQERWWTGKVHSSKRRRSTHCL